MAPVRIALDVGPLHGHRTGVGAAVAEMRRSLDEHPDAEVLPYVLSFRSRPEPPTRRLPLPAAVAQRVWARFDRPDVDRWLTPADVVHGTNYVVPPSRLPRVVSVYDCWFLAHPDQAAPAVRRAGAVLRRSVRGGAIVHASSTATADAARVLLGTSRVEVVLLGPPAVPTAAVEPPRAAWVARLGTRPFVLAVGTEERRKNLPMLIEAFASAGPDLDGVTLVTAGAGGDDSPAVDRALAALSPATRARVHRLGPVDAPTKSWLLRSATALAYPSLDEGFGFPILEAQSVGLPVVATRAGSIPEVAGDAADLIPLGSPDGLAAALVRLVHDDAHRTALIAAGRRNVDRFSWRATADGLVELYRRARADAGGAR